jgi:predicted Fe-Mo cluster-binding NifX family protein
MDPRFGRSPWFILFDPSNPEEIEAISNDDSTGMAHGAGIQTAQMLADRGVEVVITGRVGPKAQATLDAAGIEVVTVAEEGTVASEIERYCNRLSVIEAGSRESEATGVQETSTEAATMRGAGGGRGGGMGGVRSGGGGGQGGGRGMGQGGGQGRGGGRGMGRGGGMGQGGNCICPKCKTTVPHEPGNPCTRVKCPECGATMVREGMI